jgi:hypothetical protein
MPTYLWCALPLTACLSARLPQALQDLMAIASTQCLPEVQK